MFKRYTGCAKFFGCSVFIDDGSKFFALVFILDSHLNNTDDTYLTMIRFGHLYYVRRKNGVR